MISVLITLYYDVSSIRRGISKRNAGRRAKSQSKFEQGDGWSVHASLPQSPLSWLLMPHYHTSLPYQLNRRNDYPISPCLSTAKQWAVPFTPPSASEPCTVIRCVAAHIRIVHHLRHIKPAENRRWLSKKHTGVIKPNLLNWIPIPSGCSVIGLYEPDCLWDTACMHGPFRQQALLSGGRRNDLTHSRSSVAACCLVASPL